MTDLLKKAAKTFRDQACPFSLVWLVKNEVTPSQCEDMSDIIGAVVRWFADQGPKEQARVLLHGFHPELAAEQKEAIVTLGTAGCGAKSEPELEAEQEKEKADTDVLSDNLIRPRQCARPRPPGLAGNTRQSGKISRDP